MQPYQNISKNNIYIILILIIGFIIRSYFLFQPFHADEFYDILASLMISYKGIPELPSGSWWLSGGANLILEVPFVKIFGPFSKAVRIPSLLLSTLSIFVIYKLGTLMNRRVAIFAALLWAVDLGTLEWGSYARQYAIYPLCFFASLYFFYKASQNSIFKIKEYFLAFVFYFLAIWSHPPSMLFAPAIIMLCYITQTKEINYKNFFSRKALKNTFYVSAIMFFISITYYKLMSYFDPGLLYSASEEYSLISLPTSLRIFVARIYYFLSNHFLHQPLRIFGLVCLAMYSSFWTYRKVYGVHAAGENKENSEMGITVVMFFLLSVVVLAHFAYSQPGYPLALVGLLYLSAAVFIDMILSASRKHMRNFLYVIFWIIFISSSFFNWKQMRIDNSVQDSLKAYEYILKNARKDDAVLSSDPLFFMLADLKKNSLNYYFYCAKRCGLSLVKKEEKLYDRFIGGKNLKNISDFDELFSQNKRVWFVFFECYNHSEERYPKSVTNYALGKMKKVYDGDNISIYKYEQ